MTAFPVAQLSDKARRVIRCYGVWGTFVLCVGHCKTLARRYPGMRFDRRYGVDTEARMFPHELNIDGPALADEHSYEPTPPNAFHEIIRLLPIQPADFVFVDFGCGKGRTLLLAAEAGFREIIGVELSPVTSNVATNNIAIFSKIFPGKSRICVKTGDAKDFEIPNTPCVLYFYNPFPASIMAHVLSKIEKSYAEWPRYMVLIFYNLGESTYARLTQSFTRVAQRQQNWRRSGFVILEAHPPDQGRRTPDQPR